MKRDKLVTLQWSQSSDIMVDIALQTQCWR